MAQPTVVSAYYPIPSKFSIEKYLEWMIHFWPKTTFPLVFFTDPQIVPQFELMFKDRGGPTRVIGLAFGELAAFQKLSPKVWMDTRKLDPEQQKHSAELYALWYEKKEFVLRTIQLNPFGSDRFVWCDAGIARYPDWFQYLNYFPRREMIPADKMLVLRIAPFEGAVDKHGIPGNFKEEVTVGGGILAADVSGWISWSKAYDAMLMKYYLADRFIGKDQNIMASVILKNPQLAVMVDPSEKLNVIQRWFYLLFFLGGVRVD
jgi:hypothetical protein